MWLIIIIISTPTSFNEVGTTVLIVQIKKSNVRGLSNLPRSHS